VAVHVEGIHHLPLNILVILLMIFNLYCIFLQRYNYLKMRKLATTIRDSMTQQYERQMQKIHAMDNIFMTKEQRSNALNLLQNVETVFTNSGCFFMTEDDIETLEQMKAVVLASGIHLHSVVREEAPLDLSVDGGIHDFHSDKHADIVAGLLKRLLQGRSGQNGPKDCVLVTLSAKCEELYSEIFGNESTDVMQVKLKLIRYIYMNKVQVEP
jgi:hypothetical protein